MEIVFLNNINLGNFTTYPIQLGLKIIAASITN